MWSAVELCGGWSLVHGLIVHIMCSRVSLSYVEELVQAKTNFAVFCYYPAKSFHMTIGNTSATGIRKALQTLDLQVRT